MATDLVRPIVRVGVVGGILLIVTWTISFRLQARYSTSLYTVALTIAMMYWTYTYAPFRLLAPVMRRVSVSWLPAMIVPPPFAAAQRGVPVWPQVAAGAVAIIIGAVMYGVVLFALKRMRYPFARDIGLSLLCGVVAAVAQLRSDGFADSLVRAVGLPARMLLYVIGRPDPFTMTPEPQGVVSFANEVTLFIFIMSALTFFAIEAVMLSLRMCRR
jgi:hypothetical protein